MAKANDKGIPLEDYIKVTPEPHVRVTLDRGELRYTWTDANNNARASDDGGPQPSQGWWTATATTIDSERRSVKGSALVRPTFPDMFFVKVYPAPAVRPSAQEARHPGRPSSASLVLDEAERRLRGSNRASLALRGRKDFLDGLSDWLRDTHPEVPPMAAKTIGDHVRDNVDVRALLPESWLRRK